LYAYVKKHNVLCGSKTTLDIISDNSIIAYYTERQKVDLRNFTRLLERELEILNVFKNQNLCPYLFLWMESLEHHLVYSNFDDKPPE
jgi:hypothetical protein